MKTRLLSAHPAPDHAKPKAKEFSSRPILVAASADYIFTALTYRWDDAKGFAASSCALTRWTRDGQRKVVFTKKDECRSLACLPNGDLVVDLARGTLDVLSPNGKAIRKLDAPFVTNWLGVGGTPAQLFACTNAQYSNKECNFVAVWDTTTWERTYIKTNRTSEKACLSEIGLSRRMRNDHVGEWPWKGAVKTTVVETKMDSVFGDLDARVPAGFLFTQSKEPNNAFFRAPDGTLLWNRAFTGKALACGGNRVMLVGARQPREGEPLFAEVLDAATGNVLATAACKVWAHHAVYDPHTKSVVVVGEDGIEIIEDLPELAGVTTAAPAVAQKKETGPSPLELRIQAFGEIVEAICATTNVRTLKALHAKLNDFDQLDDVMVASEDPGVGKAQKTAAKYFRNLKKHAKACKGDAQTELENILDTVYST